MTSQEYNNLIAERDQLEAHINFWFVPSAGKEAKMKRIAEITAQLECVGRPP